MIVYLVNSTIDYEGTFLCEIFSTRELAVAYMLRRVKRTQGTRSRRWKKFRDDCWRKGDETIEVEEWEVQEKLTRGR